jgi:hypothetical protein
MSTLCQAREVVGVFGTEGVSPTVALFKQNSSFAIWKTVGTIDWTGGETDLELSTHKEGHDIEGRAVALRG